MILAQTVKGDRNTFGDIVQRFFGMVRKYNWHCIWSQSWTINQKFGEKSVREKKKCSKASKCYTKSGCPSEEVISESLCQQKITL